jgi:hypothetical protein
MGELTHKRMGLTILLGYDPLPYLPHIKTTVGYGKHLRFWTFGNERRGKKEKGSIFQK